MIKVCKLMRICRNLCSGLAGDAHIHFDLHMHKMSPPLSFLYGKVLTYSYSWFRYLHSIFFCQLQKKEENLCGVLCPAASQAVIDFAQPNQDLRRSRRTLIPTVASPLQGTAHIQAHHLILHASFGLLFLYFSRLNHESAILSLGTGAGDWATGRLGDRWVG